LNGFNYYRLNTINIDGTNEYSNIIVLENFRNKQYFIYPNPIFNNVNYRFDSDIKDDIEIKIVDILGKVIIKKDFDVTIGYNRLTLDLKELQSGTYTIVITHKNFGITNSTKIIKL